MIRRFFTWLRGPLCDFGWGLGGRGCLRRAVEFHDLLPTHTRGLRWCSKHATIPKRWPEAARYGRDPRRASPGPNNAEKEGER